MSWHSGESHESWTTEAGATASYYTPCPAGAVAGSDSSTQDWSWSTTPWQEWSWNDDNDYFAYDEQRDDGVKQNVAVPEFDGIAKEVEKGGGAKNYIRKVKTWTPRCLPRSKQSFFTSS